MKALAFMSSLTNPWRKARAFLHHSLSRSLTNPWRKARAFLHHISQLAVLFDQEVRYSVIPNQRFMKAKLSWTVDQPNQRFMKAKLSWTVDQFYQHQVHELELMNREI